MSFKVLVSDKISEDGLAVFKEKGIEADFLPNITQEEILEKIHEYHGWVIRSRSRATEEIIARADNLRVIGRAGVGVDNVDTKAATEKGVIVMNTPGGNTTSTAEHTVSMLLSLARKIPMAYASMKEGKWDKKAFMGVELFGKTLGIMGLGRIGQLVVQRLKAFDMDVLGYDPFISEERMRQLGVEACSVDEICERADFITVHTPLTPETRDLINSERISKMKQTVRIVNCARGGIVNEEALLEALKSGRIAGAALDVFSDEPLAEDHPYRQLDNIVITPHIAASTTEAQENVAIQVAHQVADLLNDGQIRNALNAASVDAELLPVLGPYMNLAEKLGMFVAQYRKGRAVKLTMRYSGPILKYPLDALTTSAAVGFLKPNAEGHINSVNARSILHDRGVEIEEVKVSELHDYENLISITVKNEDGSENEICGTLFTSQRPRIVMLNDKHFDAVPEGNIVVIENEDIPGIIGLVGSIFGKHEINIGEMTWGRVEDGSAMTLINVDSEVSEALLAELRELPRVRAAQHIQV